MGDLVSIVPGVVRPGDRFIRIVVSGEPKGRTQPETAIKEGWRAALGCALRILAMPGNKKVLAVEGLITPMPAELSRLVAFSIGWQIGALLSDSHLVVHNDRLGGEILAGTSVGYHRSTELRTLATNLARLMKSAVVTEVYFSAALSQMAVLRARGLTPISKQVLITPQGNSNTSLVGIGWLMGAFYSKVRVGIKFTVEGSLVAASSNSSEIGDPYTE